MCELSADTVTEVKNKQISSNCVLVKVNKLPVRNLGFVVPCIFKYSIKHPTRCTINLIFIALSHRHHSTCFRHCCAYHQEPPPTAFAASGYRMIAGLDMFQAVVSLLVNQPQLETHPTRQSQSYGNQRLQRLLEGAPDDGHNSAQNMLSGFYATKQ
jgi:hypothetical protein